MDSVIRCDADQHGGEDEDQHIDAGEHQQGCANADRETERHDAERRQGRPQSQEREGKEAQHADRPNRADARDVQPRLFRRCCGEEHRSGARNRDAALIPVIVECRQQLCDASLHVELVG